MKYLLYGVIGVVLIFFILTLLGYNVFYIIAAFEWVTRYIFPWIALYWFIQFVKNQKNN
ncbi:hypothetical protein GCM10007063_33300 [Lentibacillus kapialis]|uniref:Uncharacterized protein n=1 Tax=Lentibacillus kapialis TaxID=340214 RepID=A0A917Q2T7_9BACI|nr:hypothetical protein GCM10007063_33300 [Lentibacillus kapialis]